MSSDDDDDDDDGLSPSDEALLRDAAHAPARAPAEVSLIGRRIGKYEVEELLGRGGMGVVYVARDTALDRRVAFKVMATQALGSEERRQRFLREAKNAAAATGANIAAIYDVGAEGGVAWFAMELVEGRTLRARLAEGPLEVADVLRIARGISRALSRAHGVGIIHRDLKPDNVMLDVHGEAKVLDFGLAKRDGDPVANESKDATAVGSSDLRTQEGRLLGTPAYMSPEQAKGLAVTSRSDVFSFGTMLYEMLAGERPFAGSTTAETLLAIETAQPKVVSTANPLIPGELDALVARCLAKSPDERPASEELEAELGAIIGGLGAPPSQRSAKREGARRSASTQPSRSLSEIQATPSAMTGAVTPAGDRKKRSRIIAIAAIAAVGIAAFMLSSRRASPTLESSAPASSAAVSASAVVVAEPDYPMPASSVPAALQAYRAHVAGRRDGTSYGVAELERAVALDPELTAAHLDLAVHQLFSQPLSVGGRTHLRAALSHEDRLTPPERDLAHAIEPLGLRNPGDWKETTRRLGELKKRYPQDLRVWRLWAASNANMDIRGGADGWAQVIAVAPDALGPRGTHAESLMYAGRPDEARAELDACLARSSQAVKCLWERIKIARYEGQCDRMEEAARQFVVVQPKFALSYASLAESLAGRQPSSAVRAVLAQRWPTVDEDERAVQVAIDTANADTLDGDFVSALAQARAEKKLVASSPLRSVHAQAARREALLLLELGRQDEARAVAKDFADRRGAWEGESLIEDMRLALDATPTLLAMAADPSFARERERWETDASAQAGLGWAPHVWLNARAFPAWVSGTRADAEDALAALERVSGPPTFMPDSLGVLPIGAAYLRANRTDEAIPWLERAARTCRALDSPVEHTRALDLLGQAREAKGDHPAACEAYRKVIARWGRAPSSLTASHARARSRALGCEKIGKN